MKSDSSKKAAEKILNLSDIQIDGKRPWDIQVKDDRLYKRVISHGSLGLGESYMDGWWETKDLVSFFEHIISADLSNKVKSNKKLLITLLQQKIMNPQFGSRSWVVGKVHYDLGNELFEVMLDKSMTYTCAYWKNAKTLDQAQLDKLDLVCKKLGLRKGMKVLDIGCGWGSFAKFASQKYGVSVVGVTISKEQVELARKLCKGLNVKFLLQDYRDIQGKYDRIVSLGMFEHVGVKNYKTFMKIAAEHLSDEGLFLLHTIGANDYPSTSEVWLNKYIFPNSQLPTISTIGGSIENLFILEDLHNFGADYEKTLLAWHKNFVENWPKIKNKYDERFYRMWTYYLLMCAASFRLRKNQLWQFILSKKGVPGGYKSLR